MPDPNSTGDTSERDALAALLEQMLPHLASVLQADYPQFRRQLDEALAAGDESQIAEVFGRFPALQDELEKALAGQVSLMMAAETLRVAWDGRHHGQRPGECGECGRRDCGEGE